MAWILVGIGGALGAMMRFAVVGWTARTVGAGFPLGTLCVNVVGSFAMGLAATLLILRLPEQSEMLRPLLMTGILGGFTTFSAFSLDAVLLFEEDRLAAALGYVLASVVLSILALVAGLFLARRLFA